MEYWVDSPCGWQLKFIGDGGYLFDYSEGAVALRGEFCSLIGKCKMLSFKLYLLIDIILCWRC